MYGIKSISVTKYNKYIYKYMKCIYEKYMKCICERYLYNAVESHNCTETFILIEICNLNYISNFVSI